MFDTAAQAVATTPAGARALQHRYELMEFAQRNIKARIEAKQEIIGCTPEEIDAIVRGRVSKFNVARMQEVLELNGVEDYPR